MPTLTADIDLPLSATVADGLADDYAAQLDADGPRRKYACLILHLTAKRDAYVVANKPALAAAVQVQLDAAQVSHDTYDATVQAAKDAFAVKLGARIAASPYASHTNAGYRHNVAAGTVTLLGVDDQAVVAVISKRLHPLVHSLRTANPTATRPELRELVRQEIHARTADPWDDAV